MIEMVALWVSLATVISADGQHITSVTMAYESRESCEQNIERVRRMYDAEYGEPPLISCVRVDYPVARDQS